MVERLIMGLISNGVHYLIRLILICSLFMIFLMGISAVPARAEESAEGPQDVNGDLIPDGVVGEVPWLATNGTRTSNSQFLIRPIEILCGM